MVVDIKSIRIKSILKFIGWFLLTYLIIELCEYIINCIFHIDIKATKGGMLLFIVIYGFKYHIICCVIPFLAASYKCRHKKCKHKHCD